MAKVYSTSSGDDKNKYGERKDCPKCGENVQLLPSGKFPVHKSYLYTKNGKRTTKYSRCKG